jgi:hypothetical protein
MPDHRQLRLSEDDMENHRKYPNNAPWDKKASLEDEKSVYHKKTRCQQ